MTQVQTIEGNVVLAFRPSPSRPRQVGETKPETGTVILFTGTRYERRPDAEPTASKGPVQSDSMAADLDLAHS